MSTLPSGAPTPATLADNGSETDVAERRAARERRTIRRLKTLKGADIWPHGPPLRCIVRNLSDGGACLEISVPVPDNFEMIFDSDKVRRKCRVAWREDGRIGVEFLD